VVLVVGAATAGKVYFEAVLVVVVVVVVVVLVGPAALVA
jgi:hypothetical protein